MTLTLEALEKAGFDIEGDRCPNCLAHPRCARWIAAGTLTCEPYPCLCSVTREEAPEWIDEPSCWWRARDGRLKSRCPCWGRPPVVGPPADCCSTHPANPATAILVPVSTASEAPGAFEGYTATGPGEFAWEALNGTGQRADSERPPPTPEPAREAFARQWSAEECTCACETPWDGQTVGGGFHCVGCHTNWVNVGTAQLHQRFVVGHRCRDPRKIVDIGTGRPALAPRSVNGHTVWAMAR